MKKLATLFLICTFALGVFAQSEPFVKSTIKLAYGSTILDAAMMFKKDYPEFKSMTKTPVSINTLQDPDDAEKSLKVEAAYFRNEDDQVLVELYFVNDLLYAKSIYWFFHKDSVDAVEKKYMKATNLIISNPTLLNYQRGSVKHTEESYQLGKKTLFPIQKQGPEVRNAETGYELVYTAETGGRGFWVHLNGLNTFESDISNKIEIPLTESPQCTFSELEQTLLPPTE